MLKPVSFVEKLQMVWCALPNVTIHLDAGVQMTHSVLHVLVTCSNLIDSVFLTAPFFRESKPLTGSYIISNKLHFL